MPIAGYTATKEDVINYCLNTLEFYEHYHEYGGGWYGDESPFEEIKSIALEQWIYQDILDFAYEHPSNVGDEILGDYYWRAHKFYELSTTDEGRQVYANAMNASSNLTEYLWDLECEEETNKNGYYYDRR